MRKIGVINNVRDKYAVNYTTYIAEGASTGQAEQYAPDAREKTSQ
jgi:hypothetical protein